MYPDNDEMRHFDTPLFLIPDSKTPTKEKKYQSNNYKKRKRVINLGTTGDGKKITDDEWKSLA